MDDRLLILDRQAILGRLSAGLVHAMNNVLSGVLGQVDLLLLTRAEPQIQKDLEQIASTCEAGVVLTKSLTRVITAMRDATPADLRAIVEALIVLLSRIHRRAGVKAEFAASGMLGTALRGDEFTQAAFHVGLLAFESLAQSNETSKELIVSASVADGRLSLEFAGSSPLFAEPPAADDAVSTEGIGWRYRIIDETTLRAGGGWSRSPDGRRLSLAWPAGAGGSVMIY